MQKITLMLKRQQHASIFLSILSLGFIVGVALALLPKSLLLTSSSWITGALLLTILCFWQRKTWMLILMLVVGIVLGVNRAAPDVKDIMTLQPLIGSTATVEGVVSDDINIGKKNDQQIKLNQLTINGKNVAGTMWVSTYDKTTLKRSYKVKVTGTLKEGFGNFVASMFRADVDRVVDMHNDKAREIRDIFSDAVRKNIAEPEASLGIGYVVGQRSTLPQSFEQALRIVGLTHIVVASGYNLTILVRFARRLFAPISKYQAAVAGGLMIVGFVMITGFSPSMTRAGVVAGLSLATWYYGRSIHPLVLLPFAAALTLLINPTFIWGDLGWYLSFAAFAGVMILAPLLQQYFFGPKKPSTIRQILGETLSAQLTTLPIIAFSFGTFSVFALPANLLVLPFVPFAMLLVFATGLATLFVPFVAYAVAQPTQWLLTYMVKVVDWVSELPHASIEISFGVVGLVVSYLLIICVALWLQWVTKHNFRDDNIVE